MESKESIVQSRIVIHPATRQAPSATFCGSPCPPLLVQDRRYQTNPKVYVTSEVGWNVSKVDGLEVCTGQTINLGRL